MVQGMARGSQLAGFSEKASRGSNRYLESLSYNLKGFFKLIGNEPAITMAERAMGWIFAGSRLP